MWSAAILFCWIHLSGPQCLIAEDRYGPYKDKTACTNRLEEMEEVIRRQMPFADIRAKECTRAGEPT